jgi:hypothetical protein
MLAMRHTAFVPYYSVFQSINFLQGAGLRGLLEKYPTFGRNKETGLLGALDT